MIYTSWRTFIQITILGRIWTHLLVQFDPRQIAARVGVLQPEEPHLAESDRLHHLIEQLLAGGRLLDRKLQLGVHRRHTYIDLESERERRGTIEKCTS